MNKDYSVKKKYAEQKYQIGVTTYANGVENGQFVWGYEEVIEE